MPKANLSATDNQADFSPISELCFQPLPGDGFVPFSYSNGGLVQQPAQTQGGIQQLGRSWNIPRYAAQAHRATLINANDQPDKIVYLTFSLKSYNM